ncbi:MAG TPA: ATP-binding protein [Vicinamibacterales bacterium]|nr:ATP-binding protein [Vicinamibacterales bacterium]
MGPEEPLILGNSINLLANARNAVADSVRKPIHIRGSIGSVSAELVFADTGSGIPPGLEQRVFDPFFTTKEVGKGTGLGLSIAYGIIKDHGGTISVVSRPGEGATFFIHLPLADGWYRAGLRQLRTTSVKGSHEPATRAHRR